MAFSKSESSSTSRKASISAALAACRTSSPLAVAVGGALLAGVEGFEAIVLDDAAVAGGGAGAPASSWKESPSKMKTSHTRSCAANGIDRLNSVKYHFVP